jgi:hypothetical protein
MLFVAVVFAAPLFTHKRITDGVVEPDAVDPFVAVYLTMIESIREPLAPAVNASTIEVPTASVPSIALVFVIAVLTRAFIAPTSGVRGKIGAVLAGMIKIL